MRHHRALFRQRRCDLGQAPGDEFKGKPVKAVAADAHLFKVSWDRKAADGRRKAMMEGGIEAGDLP